MQSDHKLDEQESSERKGGNCVRLSTGAYNYIQLLTGAPASPLIPTALQIKLLNPRSLGVLGSDERKTNPSIMRMITVTITGWPPGRSHLNSNGTRRKTNNTVSATELVARSTNL